ncbi:MAG TPA: zf-HC2 domain-containing protein, partial [Candidatus Polarisedimenticolia bacterium]|nr:zf-HC2 domain-containing protein [Candidatus Polarisedimenticolia bacterium]
MKAHRTLDDRTRSRAALHALDALSPEEASAYEAHLSICGACRAEVATLSAVATELNRLAPRATPPQRLRARVMEGVAGLKSVAPLLPADDALEIWKDLLPTGAPGGITVARAAGAVWETTPLEGVEIRRLYLDAAAERITM